MTQKQEELFRIACECYNQEESKRITCEDRYEIQMRLMKWFRWGFMYGYAKANGLTTSHDGDEVVINYDN